jgi:transposase
MVGTINAVSGAQCELCTPFRWNHPAQSELFYQLCQKLSSTAAVEVVLEPTGTYGDPLVYHLGRRGLAVYLVRPDLAQKMTLLYDGHPSSHDAKSACILAELHVQGRSRVWEPEDEARRRIGKTNCHCPKRVIRVSGR